MVSVCGNNLVSTNESMNDQQPWYAEGLKFKCSGCGNCCTGSPGFVWVNAEEIEQLAMLIGESVENFEKYFVRQVGVRKSLRELPNSFDCVFFDNQARTCQVYSARPRQCRTWPFWDSNLRTKDDWNRTCEVCPGSGKGKLYQLDAIEQQRKMVKV